MSGPVMRDDDEEEEEERRGGRGRGGHERAGDASGRARVPTGWAKIGWDLG